MKLWLKIIGWSLLATLIAAVCLELIRPNPGYFAGYDAAWTYRYDENLRIADNRDRMERGDKPIALDTPDDYASRLGGEMADRAWIAAFKRGFDDCQKRVKGPWGGGYDMGYRELYGRKSDSELRTMARLRFGEVGVTDYVCGYEMGFCHHPGPPPH